MSVPDPIGLPALLRRLNTANVLRTIRATGPLSRTAVARATGLSQPTVNQIAARLVETGYVLERNGVDADRPPRRGRRAALLAFNAGVGHVLGIDIGAERIVVLVSDLGGKVVARERRATGTAAMRQPEPLLGLVSTAAAAALAAAGVKRRVIMATGVGVPGSVDPVSGTLKFVPALPGWEGLDVAGRLASALPRPALVNNDMHLAILAERGFGAAMAVENAVYLHLGVGIGLGIMIGGQLYRGTDGAAGEIAFLPIGTSDVAPEFGFGRFEWAAGATAFARLGRRAAAAANRGRTIRELAGGDPQRVDAAVIFEAARRGDRSAREILGRVIEQLAHGIAAVNCILNPGTLILGGEIAAAGSILVAPLVERLAAISPRPFHQIILSSLGEEAIALGAVQVALRSVDERLFKAQRDIGARL